MLGIKFTKTHENAQRPSQSRDFDAGYDLYSVEDMSLPYGKPVKIKTGINMEIPPGYVGLIWPRSGLGSKGVQVFGGVIDSTYRGEILVCLIWSDLEESNKIKYDTTGYYPLPKGTKIAQILIQPVESVNFIETNALSETERGNKGFGSSDMS